MGTKMAPPYANIFMGRLEKQLQRSVTPKPLSCSRFIDDIDMKWIHGRETLEAFLETANSFHSAIRFTAEVLNDDQVFLDTTSHLVDDKVVVDLYTKPTNSHQYLLPTSCHPPYCSKNIPYSLALRIRRICSDHEAFEKSVSDLSLHLNKSGYQKQVIDQAIENVRHIDRQNLLSYKPKRTANKAVLPFVMTYLSDLQKSEELSINMCPSSNHQII